MSDFSDASPELHWYVIHTYTGYENKVKASLEKIIENRNLYEEFTDVRIPVEIVKDGEKETEVKIFPSYVLIKMTMNDESWHAVRNITGVTGFVGPGSRPTPLSEEEVEALNIEEKKVQFSFGVGDEVLICSGLFEGYVGVVQGISDDMKTVTALVKRGRRDMPVELEASAVKAVNK